MVHLKVNTPDSPLSAAFQRPVGDGPIRIEDSLSKKAELSEARQVYKGSDRSAGVELI
jgi:hypothetical protein